MGLSRRNFVVASFLPLSAHGGGLQQRDTQPIEEYEFDGVAYLIGPASARPDPDDSFFDNKVVYAYRYEATDTGVQSYITDDDTSWTELPTHLRNHPTAELPANPANGAIYFDSGRGLPAWWDRDHYEFSNFVDDVLTEAVTVADTADRVTVFDPGINAGSLIKGRTYQLDLMGTFSTQSGSATFTVDINLAGATDVAGIGSIGGNATDAPWSIELTFTVREHGQNGILQPHTRGLFNSEPADSHHAEVSVDTTTVTELSVDLTWDEASPTNSVTLGQAHLKQMG